MADEKDPLTLLTDSIATTLQNAAVVKRAMGLAVKNIRAYNKMRGNDAPDVTAESDVPEIILEINGGPTNINLASNIAGMDVGFTLIVNTGDQRVTQFMHPILWAIWAVFADGLISSEMLSLTWKGRTFVKKFEFSNVMAGKANPEWNRGVKGWVAINTLMFHLHFQKSDISAFVNPV